MVDEQIVGTVELRAGSFLFYDEKIFLFLLWGHQAFSSSSTQKNCNSVICNSSTFSLQKLLLLLCYKYERLQEAEKQPVVAEHPAQINCIMQYGFSNILFVWQTEK